MGTIPTEQIPTEGKIAAPKKERIGVEGKVTITHAERVGKILAYWVGIAGAIVILGLVAHWGFTYPTFPGATNTTQPVSNEIVKESLLNYRALCEIHTQQHTIMFDTAVGRILLPVFSTIIGYLFGRHYSQK